MANDLEIISRIEKKLDVKLDRLPLDKIINQTSITKGYSVDSKERVTGLALDNSPVSPALAHIKRLKNLKRISLKICQLQDASFLKQWNALDALDLGGNELTDVSFLKELTGLTSLSLWNNELTDVSFLKELTGLTSLNLADNKLTDVSFLKELTGLTALDLAGNKEIKDYSFLKEMTGLKDLDLRNNNLTDVSFLKELTGLTSLSLWNNELTDVSFLKELTGLTSLSLWDNKLTDVSFLKELTGLTSLNLGDNKEIKDYSFLKELTGLTSLYLGWNNLTDVSFLKEMDNLTIVDLNNNPVTNPPPEILTQGIGAIRDYLKSFDVGVKKKLNEVKALLVGDGGAGKTSLVKQLQGKPFDKNESATHGIDIITLDIHTAAGSGAGETVKAHLWDFGGQEIMHASHQFFLSKRSLYILVLDSRKDDKTEYWLKHIESFGGNSPVLIIINKTDENEAFDVDRNTLRRKYKNIKGFYRTSCRLGEGIEAFQKALKKEIPGVELLQTDVAESWLRVKEELEKVTAENNYISDGMFMDICRENGISEEGVRETLIEFLNELGIVLHFKELMLKDFHVLNPCWVTEAVYKIINSRYLAENNGILEEKKLDFVLNEETAKKESLDLKLDIEYKGGEQGYILSLMQQFELCYTYGRGKILVPNLLPPHEPDFKPPDHNPLEFLIRYDFLPKSIMPRFIVKSHHDIKGELRWRTGVVLQNKDFKTTAVVRADEEERTIYIRISGQRRRDHLAVIRDTFQKINGRFQSLDIKELITLPVPARIIEEHGGKDKVPQEFRRTVPYRFLLGYETKGAADYLDGETGITYPVAELLDSVVTKKERIREMEDSGREFARHKDRPEHELKKEFEKKLQEKDDAQRADFKRIKELNRRIAKEKNLRDECDRRAKKKARGSVWWLVPVNVFVFAAWAVLILRFGWNRMEPWTYLAGVFMLAANGITSIIFGRTFNSEESKKKRLEEEQQKQYALNRFSEAEYGSLQKELEALERHVS